MIQASVPFLLFHNECDEALSYYVDIFQAEILEKMTFEDVGYTEDTQRKIVSLTQHLNLETTSSMPVT